MDWFDSLIVLVCVYEFANVYICLGVSVYVLAHALICVCVCVCVCVCSWRETQQELEQRNEQVKDKDVALKDIQHELQQKDLQVSIHTPSYSPHEWCYITYMQYADIITLPAPIQLDKHRCTKQVLKST